MIEASNNISGELLPGEVLLWAGRPNGDIVINWRDLGLLVFGIIWLFIDAFLWGTLLRYYATSFLLFNVGFTFIGFFATLGHFFMDAWRRRASEYALTNQRVIVYNGMAINRYKVQNIDSLSNINFIEDKDGYGSMYFGFIKYNTRRNFFAFNSDSVTGFERQPAIRNLYELIINARGKNG